MKEEIIKENQEYENSLIEVREAEIVPLVEKNDLAIQEEKLNQMYEDIVSNIKEDRAEISNLLDNFVEMVINQGDSTSASKEALVNLIKLKSEIADKLTKVAELKTRNIMKERNTFKPFLAQQNNTYNIGPAVDRRKMIEEYKEEENA